MDDPFVDAGPESTEDWLKRDLVAEWLVSPRRAPTLLTETQVAARLASPDCTDREREWFASVKPIIAKGKP